MPEKARDLDLVGSPGRSKGLPSIIELRRWNKVRKPFDYQEDIIEGVARWEEEEPVRGLVALPTGAGKTFTCARTLLRLFTDADDAVTIAAWVAPQKELLSQAMESLESAWRSGAGSSTLDLLLLASARSFRVPKRDTIYLCTPEMLRKVSDELPELSAIIFDEAHHASADTYFELLSDIWKRRGVKLRLFLGLSATPEREEAANHKALLECFGNALLLPKSLGGEPVKELVRREVLARPVFREIGNLPGFSRARIGADPRAFRRLILDEHRWKAILEAILESAEGQTVVFALNRHHGRALAAHLKYLGESVEYVDSTLDAKQRDGVFERFHKGDTRVIVNVNLLVEGVDCPAAHNAILTYPVGSLNKLRQVVGRVLRGPSVGGTKQSAVFAIEGNQEWLDQVIVEMDYRVLGWRTYFLEKARTA